MRDCAENEAAFWFDLAVVLVWLDGEIDFGCVCLSQFIVWLS